ncbi:hypothetical protein [uncultured Tateyamaria sp.]|uniref:hypothetical protein n=1 Tax=uncultured Tateyamaria sp. TaxID=455651 RepID=UPI00260C50B2|nr:hypothetical protein [uncultured Tateyamaria sp.]
MRSAEELPAQLDIFVLEAAEDGDTISMVDERRGQMLRSIRAGVSGLSKAEPDETNIEQFWFDYSIRDEEGQQLVSATARALRGAARALKASV